MSPRHFGYIYHYTTTARFAPFGVSVRPLRAHAVGGRSRERCAGCFSAVPCLSSASPIFSPLRRRRRTSSRRIRAPGGPWRVPRLRGCRRPSLPGGALTARFSHVSPRPSCRVRRAGRRPPVLVVAVPSISPPGPSSAVAVVPTISRRQKSAPSRGQFRGGVIVCELSIVGYIKPFLFFHLSM